MQAFRDNGLPVVHTFGQFTSAPSVHVIGIDNVESGCIAARSLIARGYKNIGFMGAEAATLTQDRLTGFAQKIANQPEITLTKSYAATYSFDAGRAEMLRLSRGDMAQAYFCGDDVLSIGALCALKIRDCGFPPTSALSVLTIWKWLAGRI